MKNMVAAPPPTNFRGGDLKISDQNNCGDLSKKSNLWGAKFRGVPMNIVGKGGHTAPFSKIPPILEIQPVPTFHRSLRKTKVLNNSCNQFVYHFYPQSILVFEECLQKW